MIRPPQLAANTLFAMTSNTAVVDTAGCTVEQPGPGLVVCRYKAAAHVDGRTVRETLAARMSLPGSSPHTVVTIFPADATFEMSLFDRDIYQEAPVVAMTRALAFVVQNDLMESMVNLYFAYHPTRLAKQVFQTETEALDWARRQVGLPG